MAAFTEVFPWLSNVDPPQARPYINWKSAVLYIAFLPAGPVRHLCTGSTLMNNPMPWLHTMKDQRKKARKDPTGYISGQSAKDQTPCQVAKDQTPWSTGQGPNTLVNCPRTKHLGQLPKDQTPWSTGQGPNTLVNCPRTKHFGQVVMDQTPWSTAQGPNTLANRPRTKHLGKLPKDQTPWLTGQGPNTLVNRPKTKHLGQLPKDKTPWSAKDRTPLTYHDGLEGDGGGLLDGLADLATQYGNHFSQQ